MALKKHHGSCHCKKVKYEVEADLQKGTYRCNCSYCAKTRNWGCMVKPQAFRWTEGESSVGIYKMTDGGSEYYFCKHCGVRLGNKGYVEEIGGDFLSFSVSTIGSIIIEELTKLPIQYMDGHNNDWFNIPKVTSYL